MLQSLLQGRILLDMVFEGESLFEKHRLTGVTVTVAQRERSHSLAC